MANECRKGVMAVTFGVVVAGAVSAWAQPAMSARGCCCVGQAGSYGCADKTQGDCLALQPAAPKFAKLADWRKAVAASKAQEATPMQGGWIAEPCEKAEARIGCCCFPKLHPTESDRYDCKAGMS
jgi:hypothetical protein